MLMITLNVTSEGVPFKRQCLKHRIWIPSAAKVAQVIEAYTDSVGQVVIRCCRRRRHRRCCSTTENTCKVCLKKHSSIVSSSAKGKND